MYPCVGAVQTEEGAVANDMPQDTRNEEKKTKIQWECTQPPSCTIRANLVFPQTDINTLQASHEVRLVTRHSLTQLQLLPWWYVHHHHPDHLLHHQLQAQVVTPVFTPKHTAV